MKPEKSKRLSRIHVSFSPGAQGKRRKAGKQMPVLFRRKRRGWRYWRRNSRRRRIISGGWISMFPARRLSWPMKWIWIPTAAIPMWTGSACWPVPPPDMAESLTARPLQIWKIRPSVFAPGRLCWRRRRKDFLPIPIIGKLMRRFWAEWLENFCCRRRTKKEMWCGKESTD